MGYLALDPFNLQKIDIYIHMYLFLIRRLADLAKNINDILNVFCIFDIIF